MKKVSIIGFGRFGKTLYKLLDKSNLCDIKVFDLDQNQNNSETNTIWNINCVLEKDLNEIYKSEIIFYAVPISKFDEVLKLHKDFIKDQLLVDVLSVKIFAKKSFEKHLAGTNARAILTHPMFGPDSTKNGTMFDNLPIVINQHTSNDTEYEFIKNIFKICNLKIIELSAEDHDKMAAESQGVTHFIGRVLKSFDLKPTEIDTIGAKKLFEIKEQTCNDSIELFRDLQTYNPYTKNMRLEIGKAYDNVYNLLLPDKVDSNKTIIGIQGGIASFNESAVQKYIQDKNITNAEVKYLFTTENVLLELHKGYIDLGQFAIHNTLGKMVGESLVAMSRYKFNIVDEFFIQIKHFLMKRKDVKISEIKQIMAHPQVLLQCSNTLKAKYPHLNQVVGENEYVDTAKAAEGVKTGIIDKYTAILGNKIIADVCDFEIIDNNLQDNFENYTTFFIVKR